MAPPCGRQYWRSPPRRLERKPQALGEMTMGRWISGYLPNAVQMVQLAQKATSEPAAQKVLSEATVQKVASEPIGPFEPHPKRQVLTTVDAAPATPVGPQSAVEPKDDEVPFEATVRSWQVGVTR